MWEQIKNILLWVIFIIALMAYILLLGGCEYEQTHDLIYYADGVSDSVNIYYTDQNGEVQSVVDAGLPWEMRIEDVDIQDDFLLVVTSYDNNSEYVQVEMKINGREWVDECSGFCSAMVATDNVPQVEIDY